MALSEAAIDDLTRKGIAVGVDLRPGLLLVERYLRERVASEQPFVDQAGRYLVDAGGKRFRPMLVLLSGLVGGADPTHPDLVSAGVVVELVHLSTLYHDDVIDAADTRRGAPAAHVKWSNTVAILTGDFLLARASELSASLGVEVTRIMARTIADLCQGEIREVQGSAEAAAHGVLPVIPDREHYLQCIGEKTASLISSSCRLGALLSKQSPEAVEALTDYGWWLGMSFQLADDLLDITSERTESGKQPGTDLREGIRTLPVLLALEADGPDSPLAAMLDDPTDEHLARALVHLRHHPALAIARDTARLQAAKAKRALEGLSPAPGCTAAVEGLRLLADHAGDRVT
jgi:heptaprenyl diphosphate synthase